MKSAEQVKKDNKMIEDYVKYSDLVWKNQNDHANFIMMHDTNKLETDTCSHKSVTIFDIKTKTHVYKVYMQIEWERVENSTNAFESKFSKGCKDKESYFKKINLLVNNDFRVSNKAPALKYSFFWDQVTSR